MYNLSIHTVQGSKIWLNFYPCMAGFSHSAVSKPVPYNKAFHTQAILYFHHMFLSPAFFFLIYSFLFIFFYFTPSFIASIQDSIKKSSLTATVTIFFQTVSMKKISNSNTNSSKNQGYCNLLPLWQKKCFYCCLCSFCRPSSLLA